MRLQDKAIIVTGSTTGIGEAIARRFVAEGARVLIHGLEQDMGEKVAADLGDAASLHIDDLSDAAAPKRIVDAAIKAFGRLDAVVNNAGWVVRSTIETTDADFFDKVMAVNCRAPMLIIRAALPYLTKAKGTVLNIGSINAWSGEPTFVAYSVSKGALMTLTRNLGDTLHRENGVRVNQINPEWVLTPNEDKLQQRDGNPPDWFNRLPKTFTPCGRIIKPEEIAAAAAFWISSDSHPMSGQVMEFAQYPIFGRNVPKHIT
jgi:NAD(P)-dependent dehydrogenase (short-subunit alcohol dehydrogenase family)